MFIALNEMSVQLLDPTRNDIEVASPQVPLAFTTNLICAGMLLDVILFSLHFKASASLYGYAKVASLLMLGVLFFKKIKEIMQLLFIQILVP